MFSGTIVTILIILFWLFFPNIATIMGKKKNDAETIDKRKNVGEIMQSGELFVTGQDSLTINLSDYPSQVKVHFKDQCKVVPCNPHHNDNLEWEVVHNPHSLLKDFMLKITWDVSDVREIVWHVYY